MIQQIKEPLFVFERLEDGVPVWAFQHLCHLALLDTKTSTLIITGAAVNLFNPSSIPSLEEVQIGDLINCTADPDNDFYRAWDPPEEFHIPKGYQKMFKVMFKIPDSSGYSMITATGYPMIAITEHEPDIS